MADRDFQPQVFGHYYLLEHIAYGGMAEIYRAKSFGASGFERELVLKRVLRKLVENPDFLRMLTNEAKLTATLHHGNIAQVFELGLEEGVYYMTMEYVEGVSLKALLRSLWRSGQLPTPEIAAYLVMQIAEGLHYAHEKTDPMGQPLGIVHCDISPENVIVGFDGNVKIVDFGIARAQASFSNYKEGMVMGKFNYVAPEQAMGRPLDRRADIFSTGILLYEALTGAHPFGRKGDVDTLVRIARFTKGEVDPPSAIRPELPPAISEITMRAMAHDLGERYPTAQALAEDLADFCHAVPRAELHGRLTALLRERFEGLIRQRRETRARDPEIIQELQRARAEGVRREADDRTGSSVEPPPEPAPRAPAAVRRALVVGLAGLLLGLGVGLVTGRFLLARPPDPVLFLHSTPSGATVRVEKRERGKTPLVLPLEAKTPYLVEVELEGYEPWQEVVVAEGRILDRAVLLKARTARLEVVSDPPGAAVEVDGEARGKTPVDLDLGVARAHRVRVRLGAQIEERTVTLPARGMRLSVRFRPPAPPVPHPKKRRGRRRRRR